MGLDNARKALEKKLDQLEALSFLTLQLVPENKFNIEVTRNKINNLSKEEIQERIKIADSYISELSKRFGLKVPIQELSSAYKEFRLVRKAGKIVYAAKPFFEGMFERPQNFFGENWKIFPNHTLFGLRPTQTEKERCEWFLPEADVYMDLCAFVNELLTLSKKTEYSLAINRLGKSLIRIIILRSFNLLEAYLNGIALDYASKHMEKITENILSLVFEWDFDKKRRRYLSTRDKIFKYIPLVTGKTHCPISENNCDEMRFILDEIEPLRDAIVHPSVAVYDGNQFSRDKLEVHLGLSKDTALKAVDNVIKLMRKIDKVIATDPRRLFWLRDRNQDGFFPDIVFK